MTPKSKKVANIFRGEAASGKLDDLISVFREICDGTISDEPKTEIQAIHLEEPNVIWVYALFDDSDARDEHRSRNLDTVERLKPLLTSFEYAHQTTPLFAKGIDID